MSNQPKSCWKKTIQTSAVIVVSTVVLTILTMLVINFKSNSDVKKFTDGMPLTNYLEQDPDEKDKLRFATFLTDPSKYNEEQAERVSYNEMFQNSIERGKDPLGLKRMQVRIDSPQKLTLSMPEFTSNVVEETEVETGTKTEEETETGE